jgi:hypothetical protein
VQSRSVSAADETPSAKKRMRNLDHYSLVRLTALRMTNLYGNSYYKMINLSIQDTQGPTLWSSGQSSWLEIERSRVRFPTLPDFLYSGSGTGSTQPREDN